MKKNKTSRDAEGSTNFLVTEEKYPKGTSQNLDQQSAPVASDSIHSVENSEKPNSENSISENNLSQKRDPAQQHQVQEQKSETGLMNREEFVALTEKALNEFPKALELQELPEEETHMLPIVLLEKGRVLGDIVEEVEKNPKLETDAYGFYKRCASQEETALQIRARCLAHFRKLAAKQGEDIHPGTFPQEVSRLADFIP